MQDVFLQPIIGMIDKLGLKKVANDTKQEDQTDISNAELAKALGKLASDMPEDLAGQDMHDEKTPMETPEEPPIAPKIENSMDSAYRLQKRQDDDLDKIDQSPAPLGNPSDLDTNQDPLARMAAKIASAIEPMLKSTDADLSKLAGRLCNEMNKTAAPIFQAAGGWIAKHPKATLGIGLGSGAAIGGGLGYMGGKAHERKLDETEDQQIYQLGALVGGRMVAQRMLEMMKKSPKSEKENKEG